MKQIVHLHSVEQADVGMWLLWLIRLNSTMYFDCYFLEVWNQWLINTFLESNSSKFSLCFPFFPSNSLYFLPCLVLHSFLELLPISMATPFIAQSNVNIHSCLHDQKHSTLGWGWGDGIVPPRGWQKRGTNTVSTTDWICCPLRNGEVLPVGEGELESQWEYDFPPTCV